MKKKLQNKIPIFLVIGGLFFATALIYGCEGGFGSFLTGPSGSAGTGSIALKLDWRGAPMTRDKISYAPGLDCAAAGVSTVSAEVYGSSSALVGSAGPWTCSAHSGTIPNVPAVSEYHGIIVYGKNSSGNTVYRGEITGVKVISGGTSTVTVGMGSVSSDTIPPNDGSVSAFGGVYGVRVQITVIGFSDAGSGMSRYIIAYSTTGIPSSCSGGSYYKYSYNGHDNHEISDLMRGIYYFRVCAEDKAGNVSTGVTASASII